MKFLVMGAYGLLGSRLCPVLEAKGHKVFKQGRRPAADHKADPRDLSAVQRLLAIIQPDVVINLNALTSVDRCEDAPGEAYLANVRIVEVLVKALAKCPAYLLQVSTDQVYSGNGPHDETNPQPCNVYALSKYAGELACHGVRSGIFRTNLVGRSLTSDRMGFTDWLHQAFTQQEPLTLFDDVWFSPVHMDQLSLALERAATLRPAGVFNLGASTGASKAHFALEFARALGLDSSSAAVGKLADMSLRAPRPLDMRLDVSAFEQTMGWSLPNMDEVIAAAAADYAQ
mgnify:CR=1 FL=1